MNVENAQISWLESGLPYSTKFQDIYYSQDDELAESRHVFLEANQLAQRWEQDASSDCFNIAELGFGSGLNFLQVQRLWKDASSRPQRLHYIAFEKHPISLIDLERIYTRWPSLRTECDDLLSRYDDHSAGCHRMQFDGGITLDLYLGDAQEQLNARMSESCPPIQCWFLDGFAPTKNTELWGESLMRLVADSSDESTTLSSYSVAGKVRSALTSAGFEVQKIEGFGSKRHCLFAKKTAKQSEQSKSPNANKPWYILPLTQTSEKSALIIGAGLAGSSTAYSLARRGWQITVIDADDRPASAASGNSELALRCRLFNSHSAEAEFFLQAFLFSRRQFAQIQSETDLTWNPCGVLQLDAAMNKKNPLREDALQSLYADQVVCSLDSELASSKAGLTVSGDALLYPSGGSMNSAALCAYYLSHGNIDCLLNSEVTALERVGRKWVAETRDGRSLQADVAVIANSSGATRYSQCAELPTHSLRGQTTKIASSEKSEEISCIVSGERTIFPVQNGGHLLSASYDSSQNLEVSPADNQHNLSAAAANFIDSDVLSKEIVGSRVSLRCNSPDRRPIVGLLPDMKVMRSMYSGLSRNARAQYDTPGSYLPDIYVNIAHGSNGLASCPLSAEYLASMIAAENLPISRDMANLLNPVRFLIQDLKKQRV